MSNAFELISDLHKDARGFRPGAAYMEMFNEQPFAEQERIWDSLCQEVADREAEDARYELNAQRDFEARIEGMVADYGIDRATALRWDMEAFEVDINEALQYYGCAAQEIEHYLYRNGLGFQIFPMYVAEITAALGLTEYASEE